MTHNFDSDSTFAVPERVSFCSTTDDYNVILLNHIARLHSTLTLFRHNQQLESTSQNCVVSFKNNFNNV
jgi:hypothetical protein